MELEKILSRRIGIRDIAGIVCYVHDDEQKIGTLCALFSHPDDTIAYQALWAATHLPPGDRKKLEQRQNHLIDALLVCPHPGKRRLLLNLLYRQPVSRPLRVDFLDFCLQRMTGREELPGVQTLCMKQAYELCRSVPELLQEYEAMLDLIEPDLLPVSLRTVRKNLQKKIQTEKKRKLPAGKQTTGLRH